LYSIKESQLRQHLLKAPLEFSSRTSALTLEIPLPNGQTETFEMFESPILAPTIAARHPEIKTYAGRGTTHRNYTIRLSFTSVGFNAIILGIGSDAAYYDKVSNDKTDQVYRVYFASDAERPKPDQTTGPGNKCGVIDMPLKDAFPQGMPNRGRIAVGPNDVGSARRVFRLAMAADNEFVQSTQGGGGDVSTAFAKLVAYVNRIDAVYQKELSVTFTLVSDQSAISTNPADYTNDDQDAMLEQNQTRLDALLGNGNYDIGHVLGTAIGSGGGLASSPSVCDEFSKAQGVSGVGDGSFAPVFDDQLIAHEMGHQFSMSHSYNSVIPVCTTREATTSVEPGAGTTIMSYGFTCDDNDNDDNYENTYQPFLNFHTVSYDQAAVFIATTGTCFTTTNTGNSVPDISSKTSDMTIPKSTPFALTGTASDADGGDALTYSWEGTNIGTETPTASTLLDPSKAPFFRSYEPVATPTRTFPRLSAILDGTNTARGDKLPSVGVVTTQRLTVRDNNGGVTYGAVNVTIDGNSGPFLETTNLSGSYAANTAQTITWDVANSDNAPVNCANVNILLSTDGGQTFPLTLAADTPNDGSESVTLPNNLTTTARIKIEAVNNIFFDISNSDFSITDEAGVPIISLSAPDSIAVEGAEGPPGGGRLAADEEEDLTGFAFFRFERTDADEKLTVRFEISGTAAGDPRFTIADTVSFEIGELAFDLYVIPGEDDVDDEDEILTLTLIDEEEYDISESAKDASILIKDNDTTPELAINAPAAQTATTNQSKSGNAATELSPTGGKAPYMYSVLGNCTPPNGATVPIGNSLTINASTGAYTYTAPATAGTYYFCIQVCDAATPTANCQTATYTVTVTAPVDNSCGPKGQNVKICYYGVEQCVSQKIADRYMKLGATMGGCNSGSKAARLGVGETGELTLSLKAFPNPVQDAVTLEVLAPEAGETTFSVVDLQGKALQQRTETLNAGLNEVELRLGRLSSGIYLIRAVDASNRQATVRVRKE
ncbi:reprolysin-like metallopeptidase, partial [Persicitalea sp.]|uniref:reprolysin-like metallopeptidase n=1 Tax=Persicitalea sp. TaxID=3100273 RepID=UPI003593A905